MGIFKNKREEKECYIDKRILDARKLSHSALQKEIYLKELYLIELSEEIKSLIPSIVITIFLTIANIIASCVTISNTLISNSMTATGTTISLKATFNDEEKKEVIGILTELLDGNKNLILIAINFTTIFIIITLVVFLRRESLRNKKSKEKALVEIELNILKGELNRRKENVNINNEHLNNTIIKEVAIDNGLNS